MFEFLNAKLSIPARLTLIAACAAPPIVILLLLFVSQTLQQARFTQQELDGLAYISQVWPAIASGDAPTPFAGDQRILKGSEAFGAAGEARAFTAARGPERAVAGATLIRAVADNSRLTLDTEIGSFYAMDAATDALPRLMAAVADSRADPNGRPFSLDRIQALEDICLRDLRQAIAHDPTHVVAANLTAETSHLAASLLQATKAPRGAPSSALVAQIDRIWRIDSRDLRGMLNARMSGLRLGLMASLALVALTLGAALAIGLIMARGLSRRLNRLLQVMDRLNAGDTAVEVPYQSDSNETGRIALTLAAFRRGLIAAEDLRKRTEAANAAVHDSEARYRMLAENSTDIILHQDLDFRILYISPSAAQFGYRPEDLLGAASLDFVHPDDQPVTAQRRAAALAGQPAKARDLRVRGGRGDWIWVENTLTPILNEEGKVAGLITTLRDISERKMAEQALMDSEARYRMLAENSTDVILHQDLNFAVLYISPSAARYGYRPEDLQGLASVDFVHPDDLAALAERRLAALDERPLKVLQNRLKTGQGGWVWMESTLAPIHAEGGKIVGFITTLRDISERKAAEQALMDSEARYRMLADNTTDIIQRFNLDGVVEYMSPSVRLLGYGPEHFVGKPVASVTHADDMAEVLQRRADLLSGKAAGPAESRAVCANGEVVWLESSAAPIVDDSGQVVGVVNVMRDVTERKAAESALEEINAELRRVARTSALGVFSASLAHEVNQPLAAAVINSEASLRWMDREPPDTERAVKAIRRTLDEVRRASDIVGRMRAMVTKEAATRTEFDLNEAIREVLALTEGERVRLGITIRRNLQPCRVIGDRVQLQQVIMNLMVNAIDAMREVPVKERRLFIACQALDDGSVQITVEDRGPGVPSDQSERIFEHLFTTKTGGTGLGLPISKSIVEAHGGRLWMENAEPRGCVFKVRLPRVDAGDQTAQAAAVRSEAASTAPAAAGPAALPT